MPSHLALASCFCLWLPLLPSQAQVAAQTNLSRAFGSLRRDVWLSQFPEQGCEDPDNGRRVHLVVPGAGVTPLSSVKVNGVEGLNLDPSPTADLSHFDWFRAHSNAATGDLWLSFHTRNTSWLGETEADDTAVQLTLDITAASGTPVASGLTVVCPENGAGGLDVTYVVVRKNGTEAVVHIANPAPKRKVERQQQREGGGATLVVSELQFDGVSFSADGGTLSSQSRMHSPHAPWPSWSSRSLTLPLQAARLLRSFPCLAMARFPCACVPLAPSAVSGIAPALPIQLPAGSRVAVVVPLPPQHTPKQHGDVWTVAITASSLSSSSSSPSSLSPSSLAASTTTWAYGGRVVPERFPIQAWPHSEDCPVPGGNATNFAGLKHMNIDSLFYTGGDFRQNCGHSLVDEINSWTSSSTTPTAAPLFHIFTDAVTASEVSPTALLTSVDTMFLGDEVDSGLDAKDLRSALQASLTAAGLVARSVTYQGAKTNHLIGAFAGITDIQGIDACKYGVAS
jgi:hypothetical protein